MQLYAFFNKTKINKGMSIPISVPKLITIHRDMNWMSYPFNSLNINIKNVSYKSCRHKLHIYFIHITYKFSFRINIYLENR
jgi:hypothetical protein